MIAAQAYYVLRTTVYPPRQHGPGADGGAAAALQMHRLHSSRNGFGFGRQFGEAPSPSDYSGRTTPLDGSMHGGAGSMAAGGQACMTILSLDNA